ncbi:MAG: formimidoylglutamate deiminase, partial [Gammaproteobacteria bacterium]|nr:formimidoylglutamate deiminase [Gammaproteobacteria bacterium]
MNYLTGIVEFINMTNTFFVKKVLLADGWANDVIITLSNSGSIEDIKTGVIPPKGITNIDGILIPGMPNLHSHAFQRAFTGFSESRGQADDSFWTWRKIMYQFVDNINPEQAEVIAKQLYIEMLKSGYTSVAEFHYLHHDSNGDRYDDPAEMSHSVINAALQTGIAITHLPVYYRYSGFNDQQAKEGQRRFIHQPEEYHQLLDALFGHYRSDQRIRIGVAPHSLRASSGAEINAITNILDGYDPDAPIHIHIAEQIAEVNDCIAHTHQRPVQHLFEQCDVNKRWSLIHATHMNDQEAWELAESGAVAGLCLTTEANLGDGFFPAQLYLERQGVFGIGSDSHISVSPF